MRDADSLAVIGGIVFLTIFVIIIIGIGIAVYNAQPAWHDTGRVQSVGHTNNWDGTMFVPTFNATFTTQNHGTISVVQDHNCGFFCPSIPWMNLKVNDTIGVIRTNGGQYSVVELN